MYFLLSGEGGTDIGSSKVDSLICEGDDFNAGPMSLIVDAIVGKATGKSVLSNCGFVSEVQLNRVAKKRKRVTRRMRRFRGKKTDVESGYFFENARTLSRIALELERQRGLSVVAILFRDTDGPADVGRAKWNILHKSMLDGFEEEGFGKGVPMIPKPKSEAWLICSFQAEPYQACHKLEERSGNDASKRSLKAELLKILGCSATREVLCDAVTDRFDVDRIQMPAFQEFRRRLEAAI